MWIVRALAGLVVAALAYITVYPLPQVRVDSGDRRSGLLFGPWRSQIAGRELLIAAAAELGIPAEWHRLRGAPSNAEGVRGKLYTQTAVWLAAEPPLGKRMLADIADYYRGKVGYDRVARWYEFLHAVDYSPTREGFYVAEDRLPDAETLRALIASLDYAPVPGGPIDRALSRPSP